MDGIICGLQAFRGLKTPKTLVKDLRKWQNLLPEKGMSTLLCKMSKEAKEDFSVPDNFQNPRATGDFEGVGRHGSSGFIWFFYNNVWRYNKTFPVVTSNGG